MASGSFFEVAPEFVPPSAEAHRTVVGSIGEFLEIRLFLCRDSFARIKDAVMKVFGHGCDSWPFSRNFIASFENYPMISEKNRKRLMYDVPILG